MADGMADFEVETREQVEQPWQRQRSGSDALAASSPGGPTTADGVLDLQRRLGNRAVARLLQRQPVATADADLDEAKSRRPLPARPASAVVKNTADQKKGSASNAYGTFTYNITKNAGANGCDVSISFKAFSPEVDATKITIIQAAKGHKAGGANFYPNNDTAYYTPFDAGGGLRTDHLQSETDPFYNFEDKTQTDESVGTTSATGTSMTDAPALRSITGERGHDFETAPFALSGNDEGEFFGTITWGWEIDAAGAFKLKDVAVHDDISTGFGSALRKFIARKGELTKDATTPAPITLEMRTDMCRDLTADEKLKLKPFVDYSKAHANARIWVVARHDATGNVDANHAMARDNARGVQTYLIAQGLADSAIHVTQLEDASVKPKTTPIEITVINT
jgi:hypothetical protein